MQIARHDVSDVKLKICMLSSVHPPLDKRVFDKEAISLVQAGFEVLHLAPGDEKDSRIEQGVKLEIYRSSYSRFKRLFKLFRLYKLANEINADAYHCSEPDSWLVGVLLKFFRGKKVVFDVHEHYPSIFADWFPKLFHPLAAFFVREYMKLMERFTDSIVLTKRCLADDFKRCPEKNFLVMNCTPLAALQQTRNGTNLIEKQLSSYKGKFTFVHIGVLARRRGSEQLLHAMTLLKDLPIQVVIIGQFDDGSQDSFLQKAQNLGLADRIIFYEWMPFAQAFQNIMAADAGLILFQATFGNNILGLPHKMFDYMLAGLPVIAPSFAPEIVYIINEAKCGLLIDTADPNAIAKAMRQLVENPGKASAMGKNGAKAVVERYNWEREASVLINMYRKIFQEH